MSDIATLEKRLEAVELAIAELQLRTSDAPANTPVKGWLSRVIGSVTDEEAFLEALEYGREIRRADRPPDEPGPRA